MLPLFSVKNATDCEFCCIVYCIQYLIPGYLSIENLWPRKLFFEGLFHGAKQTVRPWFGKS